MSKKFLFLLCLCIACQTKRPNVVFILVDDLGWTDLGCYGSSFYETPHIDKLAKSGTLFTDAYAASPVCSPTRAALMTGRHPARLNITDWIPGMALERADEPLLTTPQDRHNLPLSETTLAERFKSMQYRTFFAGKWHLGETEKYWPLNQGFEKNYGGNAWGSPGRFHSENGYYSPYGNPELADGPEGEYLTDRLTSEALQFIDENKSHPFFIYLSYYTVHTPIVGCQKFDDYFEQKKNALPDSGVLQEMVEHQGRTRINQSNAKYAAMLKSLDENVGRIVKHLADLGISENTMLILTSDNGGLSTLKRSGPTSVRPLRAGKGWCYEGGIRIPLLIKFPPNIRADATSSMPTISMDLFPTLLDACNIAFDKNQYWDAQSIVPKLSGETTPDRTLVWHYPHYHGSTWRPGSAIREGAWKLIYFYEDDRSELYNLDSDLSEENNLCLTNQDKCNDLKQKLFARLREMGAKFPQPNK